MNSRSKERVNASSEKYADQVTTNDLNVTPTLGNGQKGLWV
jgi:hypothetical protein